MFYTLRVVKLLTDRSERKKRSINVLTNNESKCEKISTLFLLFVLIAKLEKTLS